MLIIKKNKIMIITEIKNYQKVRYTEKEREKEKKKVRGTNRGKI